MSVLLNKLYFADERKVGDLSMFDYIEFCEILLEISYLPGLKLEIILLLMQLIRFINFSKFKF